MAIDWLPKRYKDFLPVKVQVCEISLVDKKSSCHRWRADEFLVVAPTVLDDSNGFRFIALRPVGHVYSKQCPGAVLVSFILTALGVV